MREPRVRDLIARAKAATAYLETGLHALDFIQEFLTDDEYEIIEGCIKTKVEAIRDGRD